MSEIQLQLDSRGRGAFYIEENKVKVGEMVVGISETSLTVYHTEVNPEMEGKGYAKQLLDKMVEYAREKRSRYFRCANTCTRSSNGIPMNTQMCGRREFKS
ncbi:GNAT family N-acetyltransferase [Dyadobacter sp. NIV53]|uniref:GNAT family N-acetyltransferase n=1 Tax=Dyadobacter sp. NIV53 TaxID=2861765 RepID=UPI001E2C05BC|nr:GNAT family N-acetyltransferase [Dyadobacter sp. NIV53]